MTKHILSISFLVLVALTITSCFSSRRSISVEQGWEIIGEEKVNFITDKDEIEVKSKNQFTAIRFLVEDRDIRINELKIQFINGDKLEPAIDEEIKMGQQSRIISMGAEGRYIDKVSFRYRTTGSLLKGRGKVIILGKRYNPYGL